MTDAAPNPLPTPLPTSLVARWFAALFLAPPDAAGLAAYQGAQGRTLLAALAAEPGLAAPVAVLDALTAPGADLGQGAEALATAHAGAFLVGGPRAPQPYASVWLSPRGLLYQEPAREMIRLMAAAGLATIEGVSEAPDHISLQLDLLAHLADRAAADEDVPTAPDAFICDQLAPWVPRFAEACARVKNPYFYADLAQALSVWLDHQIRRSRAS